MRKSLAFAALAASLLFTAAPAGAAGSPVLNDFILKWQDDPKVDCKNGSTTYDINVCAGRDYQKTYRALAALYNQLYAKYDAGNKKLLLASQIVWEKYQGAECDYETAVTVGGTIHSTMVTQCDLTLATARLAQLKAQANCAEGDMSCNHP